MDIFKNVQNQKKVLRVFQEFSKIEFYSIMVIKCVLYYLEMKRDNLEMKRDNIALKYFNVIEGNKFFYLLKNIMVSTYQNYEATFVTI